MPLPRQFLGLLLVTDRLQLCKRHLHTPTLSTPQHTRAIAVFSNLHATCALRFRERRHGRRVVRVKPDVCLLLRLLLLTPLVCVLMPIVVFHFVCIPILQPSNEVNTGQGSSNSHVHTHAQPRRRTHSYTAHTTIHARAATPIATTTTTATQSQQHSLTAI